MHRDDRSGQIRNGAVASAVLGAPMDRGHFDWRRRGRPALALLAWESKLAVQRKSYAAVTTARSCSLHARHVNNERVRFCVHLSVDY